MRIAQHRSRYFLALMAAVALVVLPAGGARAAASAGESTMAREIADAVNNERVARGLSRLPYDSGYSAGAQRVAETNRDTNCHPCHSSDHPSGEVVWWGSNYPSSGSPIWWMGSPPHRALILASNATRIGVGVACNGTEHDAVAWIEVPSNPPSATASAPVTKSSAGSRCTGGVRTTATTRTTPQSTPGAAATTTPTSARSNLVAAAGPRASTTTTRPQIGQPIADTTDTTDRTDETVVAAAPFVAVESAAASRRLASASRPLAGSGGVGPFGTALLVLVFVGVIAVGRATHRGRSLGR